MFGMMKMEERHILCIDLKSFFASCECIERNLNPFTYPLVVANCNQGQGAITLAVTPYLKNKGVKSRSRLYEIPKYIKYTIVPPRMKLYIQKSKEVIAIYLDYVASEDMHVYSIDEAFLDVTDYLKLYKKNDYELALDILQTVYKKTGLTATCGIGPNMLLAKVAMDIEAKHSLNNIAKWSYEDVPTKLWPISPLSKMWGIGSRMEKRLNDLNIFSIKDLANYPKAKLKDKFGVMGEELYNHANGIDFSRINTYNKLPKEKSINHSQVLFKDYNATNVRLIIEEMLDVLLLRLRQMKKLTASIGLGIGYSKAVGGGFYHTTKLSNASDDSKLILKTLILLFDKYYDNLPIRKVSISLSSLTDNNAKQLNLFESAEEEIIKDNYNKAIDKIKEKYGKNSILKATSLLKDSTAIQRNTKIGGHSA